MRLRICCLFWRMREEPLLILDEQRRIVLAKQGGRHSVGFIEKEAEFMREKSSPAIPPRVRRNLDRFGCLQPS